MSDLIDRQARTQMSLADDTISRQTAIDEFDCTNELIIGGEANSQKVVNYINKGCRQNKRLPPAQPEIIHCRECKHYMYPHGCGHIDGMTTAQEDGYCSYAERREE